jgi:hypothetical protein
MGSGMNNSVFDLAVTPDGGLLAAGAFSSADGVPAGRIAYWDSSGWRSIGPGMNGDVHALGVLSNGDFVAAGSFTAIGGVAVAYASRWRGAAWEPLAEGLARPVQDLAITMNDDVVVCGPVSSSLFFPGYSAHWTETGVPWAAEHPPSLSVNAGSTLTLPAACAAGFDFNGPVTFRWQRNGTDISNGPGGASGGGGTVSGASGSLTSANTSTTLAIVGIRPSDAGQYTVLFTNSCGTGISLPATVTVSSGCPADLNDDAVVDGNDLGLLLAAWGPCAGTCPADLNVDGAVDGNDLGILLSAWGACGS